MSEMSPQLKLHAPRFKVQRNSKFQVPTGLFEFGTSLDLEPWNLELFVFDGLWLSGYEHGAFDRMTC